MRVELATTKKGDLSAADYFRKIKALVSELIAADAPLRDDEIIAYLLAGLGLTYDPFVTSITTKSEALTLDDVYAYLMTFEARQLKYQEEARVHVGTTANFAGRGNQQFPRGRSGARGRGAPPPNRGRGGSFPGRSRGQPSSPFPDRAQRPRCQICGLRSHTVIKCWHRMDESYLEEPPYSGMAATSSYTADSNWYTDSRATDYITSDLDRLAVREQYHGAETVQVGNCAGLQIMDTGSCSLNTATRPLTLHNVLHVPEISKHLLSVNKLSRDNDVFFEFHPSHFLIKDRGTRQLLLAGKSESGLYPIKPFDVAALSQANVSVKVRPSQ